MNLLIKMSFISDPCQTLVLSVAYPRLVAPARHAPRCRRPFLMLGLPHACSVLSWGLREKQEAFFFPSPAHSIPPHSSQSGHTLCSQLSSRVKEMAWPPCLAFSHCSEGIACGQCPDVQGQLGSGADSRNVPTVGLPWWSNGYDSMLSMQRARVRSLVEDLDPTCCSQR